MGNPWGQMPSMGDGTFSLAESSAILRYLANTYAISAYGGMDAKERARIDWALDWAATNFSKNYADIWYPVAGFGAEPADRAEANQTATANIIMFEKKFLTGKFIGGESLNIADYKIGTMMWYLDHPSIKKKTGFELHHAVRRMFRIGPRHYRLMLKLSLRMAKAFWTVKTKLAFWVGDVCASGHMPFVPTIWAHPISDFVFNFWAEFHNRLAWQQHPAPDGA